MDYVPVASDFENVPEELLTKDFNPTKYSSTRPTLTTSFSHMIVTIGEENPEMFKPSIEE